MSRTKAIIGVVLYGRIACDVREHLMWGVQGCYEHEAVVVESQYIQTIPRSVQGSSKVGISDRTHDASMK